jgi:hypothetical protein
MFDTIISLILILIELISGKMFLDIFLDKKEKVGIKQTMIIMAILELLSIVIVSLCSSKFLLKILLEIITGVMLWKTYYKNSVWKTTMIYLLFMGVCSLMEYITFAVVCWISPEIVSILYINTASEILMALLSKINGILVILVIRKIFSKIKSENIGNLGWTCIFAFSAFTIIAIGGLITNWISVGDKTWANILLCIALGLVIMDIFMFYIICQMFLEEKTKREEDICKERVEKEVESYRTIEENHVAQRELIHELKNLISIIAESKTVEKDVLVDLAKDASKKLDIESDAVNTKNPIVNMVLNAKIREIRKKGIGLLIELDDLAELRLDNEDIIIIFSNLLNNAIEASEKCQRKMIWIKGVGSGESTMISVRNTMCVPPVVRDGQYITTKEDNKEMHGIGIKNILRVIEKNKGTYAIDVDKDEFTFTILI